MPHCNDHCSNAIELLNSITTASQTANATSDPTEDPDYLACAGGVPVSVENSIWYKFTTDCSGGDVDVSFINTTCVPATTGIQVSIDKYNGGAECIPGNYTNVFCDAPGYQSDIVWNGDFKYNR